MLYMKSLLWCFSFLISFNLQEPNNVTTCVTASEEVHNPSGRIGIQTQDCNSRTLVQKSLLYAPSQMIRF